MLPGSIWSGLYGCLRFYDRMRFQGTTLCVFSSILAHNVCMYSETISLTCSKMWSCYLGVTQSALVLPTAYYNGFRTARITKNRVQTFAEQIAMKCNMSCISVSKICLTLRDRILHRQRPDTLIFRGSIIYSTSRMFNCRMPFVQKFCLPLQCS